MKILCPIDFSKASVNASKWAFQLLQEMGGGELVLAHFIYLQKRASMFVSLYDTLIEQAKNDLNQLQKELENTNDNVQVSTLVYRSHPKEGIVSLSKKKEYDAIVIGSNGLDALKNMTIGSVTEYVMNHYSIPILVIPEDINYHNLSNIAIAVDEDWITQLTDVKFVKSICEAQESTIHLIHIIEENESPEKFDFPKNSFLSEFPVKSKLLFIDEGFKMTISNYAAREQIDLLCMIHRKTNWIERLIKKSKTKSRLYELNLPLLILQS